MLNQKIVDHGEASVGPLADRQDVTEGAVKSCHHGNVFSLDVLARTTLTGHVAYSTPNPGKEVGILTTYMVQHPHGIGRGFYYSIRSLILSDIHSTSPKPRHHDLEFL